MCLRSAIAIGGDGILEKGVRVDSNTYAVGGEMITEEGALDRHSLFRNYLKFPRLDQGDL